MAAEPRATVLIPTWRAAATVGGAMRSALRQTMSDIEVLVVGDGVDEPTRSAVLEVASTDTRVRFLDLPKGENRGERNRHVGVLESRGTVTAYLADDDVLMPQHLENVVPHLDDAELVQSANAYIDARDVLSVWPTDLADPKWVRWHLSTPPRNRVSITGTAHRRSTYTELARGWDIDKDARWTDLALWRQFFRRPGFTGFTHAEVTTLQFPAQARRDLDDASALDQFTRWEQFSQEPDAHGRLQALAAAARARQLIELSARATDLQIQVAELSGGDAALARKLAHSRRELERLRGRELHLERALHEMRQTLSWRVTAPLRAVKSLVRRDAGPTAQ